jgi:phenylacetate-CoA ligase
MHTQLAERVFRFGAHQRNPTLFKIYDNLKDSEWSSAEKLGTIQLKNASRFLEFAADNSPYYEKLFKKIGFKPRELSSINEISVIPETTKSTLIHANSEIHSQYQFNKTRLAETSGTSGAALSFLRNEEWDSLNRATIMRSYDWYGVKPWSKNGYLWGYNINPMDSRKVKVLDFLQNRRRLFNYSKSEIKDFLSYLENAEFLSGYSSMIYEIAKVMNQEGLNIDNLKMIKGTSEMILDIYNLEAKRAFGQKIISEYGAAETGIIAFECPHGNMHINAENLYLESNENGEAIVTNFSSYSFPIIRYNLGDKIEMSLEVCACGRAHPILKSIVGRAGAKVIGLSKTYPALTFYYVFKNIALEYGVMLNYRVYQKQAGSVVVYIEDLSNKSHIKLIEDEFTNYFGNDVQFKCIFVDEFDIQKSKTQYFITDIKQ